MTIYQSVQNPNLSVSISYLPSHSGDPRSPLKNPKQIRSMNRHFIGTTLALAALAVGLGACGGDDDARARLRAVHASADAPAVDVLLGAQTVAAGAQFKQAGSSASVPAGSSTLRVNLAGTATTALSANVNLAENRAYGAIAVGSAAPTAPAAQALAAVLIDDDGAAPAAGNVKLRVVHGPPLVPAVDIYVTAPGVPLPATPTIAALAYRAIAPASGSAALQVPARSYRIRVTPAGQPTQIAFDSGSVALPAGGDLLIVAVPAATGIAPISLLVAPATGSAFEIKDMRAALRVAHLSPSVPAVDVFLKAPGVANSAANRVLSGVVFPQDSGFLKIASGSYDASVAVAGSLTGVLNLNGAQFAASSSTSVFAIGLLNGAGGQALRLAAYSDDRAPLAGKAKVRVLHLSPDAPAVDVVVLAGGVIASRPVTSLAFPNATATSLQLDPGSYTLAVVPAGASTPVLPGPAGVTVQLNAGDAVSIAAVGCLQTASGPCARGQAFQFKVLDDR
jgi:hypothetical protein